MPKLKITDRQISYIESLMKQTLQHDKKLEIYQSRFGTTELTDISSHEAWAFIQELKEQSNDIRKKTRGLIINRLCLMGYTMQNGTPDYDRINGFVKNIGANNPRKVILNYLYPYELNKVATQVKAMYAKEVKR